MKAEEWVKRYRADVDVLVETMSRLRARRKEWGALDLNASLVDAECGDSNAVDIKASVATWDEIETVLTNQKFATLIKARQ